MSVNLQGSKGTLKALNQLRKVKHPWLTPQSSTSQNRTDWPTIMKESWIEFYIILSFSFEHNFI